MARFQENIEWLLEQTKYFYLRCFYLRHLSEKKVFSCSERRFIFIVQKRYDKISMFHWFWLNEKIVSLLTSYTASKCKQFIGIGEKYISYQLFQNM